MSNTQKIRTTYEVNVNTMIILPKKDATHGTCSFVKEEEDEFIVLQKPTDIIKKSCESFGCSYDGIVIGVKTLTDIKYKPPIAVNPSNDIFFFPTHGAKHRECIWVSHRHVKKVSRAPHNKVEVHFTNQFSDTLNVSVRSFENQLRSAAQVKSVYLARQASQQESKQIDIIYENEIYKHIQEKRGTKCLRFQIIFE